MDIPIGICTCGNKQAGPSLSSIIMEHSASDLSKILSTELAKESIPFPIAENIVRSARSNQTILLETAGKEYKQPLNELAVWLKYKWPVGSIIKVKFLHRNDFLEHCIQNAVKEWVACANISFNFVTEGDADVRISFTQDHTSWSLIGTDCLNIRDQNTPTMNFGWFNISTNQLEIRRTTLHEFGHALGCIHEHQSPAAKIPWDVNAIRRVFVAGMKNTEEWVRINIIDILPSTDLTNSTYDADSIMHYPFDAIFTTNKRPYGVNWDLSSQDKRFIQICYPR